jgi:hypothetical protein
VTGFELAEFAKFFPQVQGRTVPITRELFYLPLVTTVVILALLAGWSAVRPVRLIAPLFAAAFLLVALLPYSIVDSLRQALTTRSYPTFDPQYIGQLTLVVVGMVLILLTLLAHQLSGCAQGVLVALLALAGGISALWQFALLYPLVAVLYSEGKDDSLSVGWGLVAYAVGIALLLLSSILKGRLKNARSDDF